MTQNEILAKLAANEITIDAAKAFLKELEPAPKVDVTKPRIQVDGKLCVIPKLTLTVYQLVKTIETAKELLTLAQSEMSAATRVENAAGRTWTGKDGKATGGGEFKKFFKGKALVAYQPEHVAYVEKYFHDATAKMAARKAA